ncbi:MAG TPA: nucleotidyltransferase family protein [Thermoplasmata archaeon]|nr:nucleotidyltransferase family protein [Thermoplasmata archaeon]
MSERGGTAIVLAAGASRRFGGRPKALLPVGRELAIERILRLCQGAGYSPIVAVVGPHETEIRQALLRSEYPPDEFRSNPGWSAGRTGSVQCGLEEADESGSALLWPVDTPLASSETLERLAERRRSDSLGLWFLPTYHGAGGHPVLFSREVFPRIRHLGPDVPLRSLLPELGPQVVRVEVDDPGVTANLNTPEEYYRALATFSPERDSWTAP